MSLETVLILLAVLNVLILFCFFVLCSNVSSIKNKLSDVDISRENKFNFYLASGQMEKAKDMLSKMILADNLWEYIANNEKKELRDESRKKIMHKYKNKMDAVGLILDFGNLD